MTYVGSSASQIGPTNEHSGPAPMGETSNAGAAKSRPAASAEDAAGANGAPNSRRRRDTAARA
eukprot:800411-Lingulodinium_polyedra.AAC.1